MPQEIGVESIWSTKKFSPGLNTYLKGLTSAIAATNNTVAAISTLGGALSNTFNTVNTNGKLTVAALQAISKAAKQTQQAIAAANARTVRQPRAARTTGSAAGAAISPGTVQQINAATVATRKLGSQARQTTISIQGMSTATVAAGTAIGTLVGQGIVRLTQNLAAFGGKVLEIVTFFERMELSVAFFSARSLQAADDTLSFNDALAAGTREAQGLFIWLQRLAVASPFTTRDVATIFRTAQAYGLTSAEAQRLTPLLLDLGAAGGLDADILLRVALALGQIRARGKLTGEEVRQLGNSGIPIRDILVKQLGIANEEFDGLLESGAFTSNVVIPAIIDSLQDFAGAGERVAFETIGGIVSAFDELREIGIAKFFTGILAPIKQSFQDLFKVLNRPEVLAFIQVLGSEIGVKLRNAVLGTVQTVRNLIAAWQALDPVMQQQIIVFALATAGVFALAAVFGLLTIAVNLLLSPLSLIAISVGFLVSEWTSGFTVLRGVATSAANVINRVLSGIVQALGATTLGFLRFLNEANAAFVGSVNSFQQFGFEAISGFAEGMNQGVRLVAGALNTLGDLLLFFLAPGSPPKIAPDIDDWGKATMEEYITGFGNANVKKSLGNGLSIVSDTISQELIDARQEAVDKLNQAHPDLNLSLAEDLLHMVEEGYKETEEALADTGPVEAEAAAAGIRVSDAFVDSFLSRIPTLTPRMSKELQDVLAKIGGGTQLTRQGAEQFGTFLEGFREADFGVLDEVSGVVQDFLQSLVDTGQIQDVDLPRLLFGAREDLAQGIQDIERVGSVTERTMQSIRATAGGASKFVLQLLNSYAPLAAATKAVEIAQNTLNAVTERYKAILTPLRQELERINEANKLADEEEKILSLRRLIANDAVSNRRRSNAQLQIDQILAERRVRGLEAEQDAATETAESELEGREKAREEAEKQFNTIQANIQAQLAQLGLFSQEASIVRKLQEEANKLREKEMTQAELQMKFLELQGEEMADLVEAARAKYTLDQADSTELEKQEAQIKLAEIALRRRNREAEAIKLGIPVEELTKLRDFEVTLDDLGIKTKEAFDFDTTGVTDGLVDADALTQQWEDTLTRVKTKWDEIKQAILDTATEINNNLPTFLKIFPEEAGGEIPLIQFIKDYSKVVIGLAVAIGTYKIAARLAALGLAIRNLATFGTLAGAGSAAAGAGGAAAGGGVAAVIAGITTAVISLGTAALVTAGYLIALKTAMDALAAGEVKRAETNTQEITDTLGTFGPVLQEETNRLFEETNVSEEAKAILSDNITSAATAAILDGFGDEHVAATIGVAVQQSFLEGLIVDSPANRRAIAQFQGRLTAALFSQDVSTGEGWKVNLLEGADLSAEPTADQSAKVQTELTGFLAGITGEETKGEFATNMAKLISDGVALGMTNAQIDTHVFAAFNAGVKAGLVSDTPENRTAISEYIDGLITLIKSEGEIKSPSSLSEREIGVPLGEGIIKGVKTALSATKGEVANISDLMFGDLKVSFNRGKDKLVGIAKEIRVDTNTEFVDLNTLLGLRMGEIILAQRTGWTTVRTDSEDQVVTMRTNLMIAMEGLRSDLALKMPEIKKIVVTAFADMKTESETEVGLLKTSIIELIAGEEGSLLTDLKEAFLGENQLIPRNIGKLFIQGIAMGITENKQKLADAMVGALQYALTSTSALLEIDSPSALAARELGAPFAAGIAQGIMENMGLVGNASRFAMAQAVQAPLEARYGGNSGGLSSATTTNIAKTTHYHLNVKSSMQSQGLVQDFGIMRTLGS